MDKSRSHRQSRVSEWCIKAFGHDQATSLPQRGIRLVEEALEAAQAAGSSAEMIHRLVDHVYSRPVGELGQELGGVGVTALALAAAAGLDADAAEATEVQRVLSKPLSHFRERNSLKNAAGFDAHSPTIEQ